MSFWLLGFVSRGSVIQTTSSGWENKCIDLGTRCVKTDSLGIIIIIMTTYLHTAVNCCLSNAKFPINSV